MLTSTQTDTLHEISENDRYQKQLLQELFDQCLSDEHGISLDTYRTFCELGDAAEYVFEHIDKVQIVDNRVYLKKDPDDQGWFEFDVAYEYTDDSIWDWADNQEIATISNITWKPVPYNDTTKVAGIIWIAFQFPEQNSLDVRTRMERDFKRNAVSGT